MKIRKNATKKILSQTTEISRYTLRNCFCGEVVERTSEMLAEIFEDITSGDAGLFLRKEDRYSVRYHSNHWLELVTA